MAEEKENAKPEKSHDHKLDAIKEIIFGDQIKEYELEFRKLKEGIENQRKELEDELVQLKKEANLQLENMKIDFNKALEEFKDEAFEELKSLDNSKTDKHVLGGLLEEIGKKLKA